MLKTTLRKDLLGKRAKLSPKFIRNASEKIVSSLIHSDVLGGKSNILIYLSVNGEVDTQELLTTLQERKVNICVPAYLDGEWMLCKLEENAKLEKVFHSVLQPKKINRVDISTVDLVILPGVAFDKNGARIGMGHAVYDRLLQKSNTTRVGLAYEFQIVHKINKEQHDVCVDYIVTEKRVFKII